MIFLNFYLCFDLLVSCFLIILFTFKLDEDLQHKYSVLLLFLIVCVAYMCVVDGCEAGEDVVELSSAALQVGEITSPAYSQFLLSVELQQGAGAQRHRAVRMGQG